MSRVVKLLNLRIYGYVLKLEAEALEAVSILGKAANIFAVRNVPIILFETGYVGET